MKHSPPPIEAAVWVADGRGNGLREQQDNSVGFGHFQVTGVFNKHVANLFAFFIEIILKKK